MFLPVATGCDYWHKAHYFKAFAPVLLEINFVNFYDSWIDNGIESVAGFGLPSFEQGRNCSLQTVGTSAAAMLIDAIRSFALLRSTTVTSGPFGVAKVEGFERNQAIFTVYNHFKVCIPGS